MRADGVRVTDVDPMYSLIPYFLTKRYDAMNMVTVDVPVEPMKKYMNECRKRGKPISHLALIIAAYLRAAAEFPALNRFVVNKKIYAHKQFAVSMVVLRPGSDDDTMSKIYLDYKDDIFTVQDKVNGYIDTNRVEEEGGNGLDKVMKIFLNLPGLMAFLLGIVRWADRHGLLPKALIKVSPFHASLLISNLASIRTNHIYHHVYEFGTTSVAITMGNMREVPRRTKDGIIHERCIPLGVVMDERIASGHYLAQAFARMKDYLADPSLLEGEPQRIAEGV